MCVSGYVCECVGGWVCECECERVGCVSVLCAVQ